MALIIRSTALPLEVLESAEGRPASHSSIRTDYAPAGFVIV